MKNTLTSVIIALIVAVAVAYWFDRRREADVAARVAEVAAALPPSVRAINPKTANAVVVLTPAAGGKCRSRTAPRRFPASKGILTGTPDEVRWTIVDLCRNNHSELVKVVFDGTSPLNASCALEERQEIVCAVAATAAALPGRTSPTGVPSNCVATAIFSHGAQIKERPHTT